MPKLHCEIGVARSCSRGQSQLRSAREGSAGPPRRRPPRRYRAHPVIRAQRWKAVSRTGPVALLTRGPVRPRRHELAARRWPIGVYRAAHLVPDGTLEGDAARGPFLGSGHRRPVRIELHRQRPRHAAAEKRLSLGPVKGNAVVGAACAARGTRIHHCALARRRSMGTWPGGARLWGANQPLSIAELEPLYTAGRRGSAPRIRPGNGRPAQLLRGRPGQARRSRTPVPKQAHDMLLSRPGRYHRPRRTEVCIAF